MDADRLLGCLDRCDELVTSLVTLAPLWSGLDGAVGVATGIGVSGDALDTSEAGVFRSTASRWMASFWRRWRTYQATMIATMTIPRATNPKIPSPLRMRPSSGRLLPRMYPSEP